MKIDWWLDWRLIHRETKKYSSWNWWADDERVRMFQDKKTLTKKWIQNIPSSMLHQQNAAKNNAAGIMTEHRQKPSKNWITSNARILIYLLPYHLLSDELTLNVSWNRYLHPTNNEADMVKRFGDRMTRADRWLHKNSAAFWWLKSQGWTKLSQNIPGQKGQRTEPLLRHGYVTGDQDKGLKRM